ncbi:MAG: hypothetical protein ACE366_00055 [Bradymonadia bacterium]
MSVLLAVALSGCGKKPEAEKKPAPADEKAAASADAKKAPEKPTKDKGEQPAAGDTAAKAEAKPTAQPAAQPATPPSQPWRLSTLTTSEQKPHGETAHFDISVSVTGDTWKIIFTRPAQGELPALKGEATAKATQGDGESDAKNVTLLTITPTLKGGDVELPMLFELRFMGPDVSGYWAYQGAKWSKTLEPGVTENLVYGAVIGTQGNGAPVPTTTSTVLPCVTCCNVMYRCGPQGPGSCNSSNTCIAECMEKPGQGDRACLKGE